MNKLTRPHLIPLLGLSINGSAIAAPNLSAAEYFIDPSPWLSTATSGYTCDNDPGLGQGTPLVANDGAWDSIIETAQLTNINSSALAVGTHAACVRFKDNNGSWGPIRTTYFTTGLIDSFTRILIACEYYIDTDPGIGAGQPLSATDGLFDENTETVAKTAIPTKNPTTGLDLTTGTHTVGVRCKDNIFGSERWGMAKTGSLNICCDDLYATTNAATNVTATSATLNGSVISKSATATASFEFGTTTSYGETVTATPAQIYSSTAVAVTASKTGLVCNTAYNFRTKAVSSAGTGLGANQTFTTLTCSATSYTVTANANPLAGGSFISDPDTATVTAGSTKSFIVTANAGYIANQAVTGTCPQGTWGGISNNVWTTGLINANCTVIFGFTAINSWLNPPNQLVIPEQQFTLAIIVKSTSVKVGQYSFTLTFDPTKLGLDLTYPDANCTVGVCPGTNALTTLSPPQVNSNTIILKGVDLQGIGPGNDLQLLVIHFKSLFINEEPSFVTGVSLKTNYLDTTSGSSIGLGARAANVIVRSGICGDADGNATVNIVDALAIARQLVGMPPPPTVEDVLADVNEDGRVGITDALHIARYSIGLVIPPEVCEIGQAF